MVLRPWTKRLEGVARKEFRTRTPALVLGPFSLVNGGAFEGNVKLLCGCSEVSR